jgi:anti-sigma-K factor RskA
MTSERVDETLLVQYLLGKLPEEKSAEVEDRAFADDDFRQTLEAAEADLIDEYVRGELSESDRRAFEQRFLASPQRRSKVEFAKALAVSADATLAGTSASVRSRPERRSLISVIRGWTPTLRFAVAFAALLCVAGVSLLVLQNVATRARVAALESDRRGLELQRQELRRQLAEQSKAGPQPSPAPASAPAIASLVLIAGLTRGQPAHPDLSLGSAVQLARIEIELDPRDDYPRFRTELRTRRGDEVLTQSNLLRRRSTRGYMVALEVPASALGAGEYELVLVGLREGAPAEELSYSYFSVKRQEQSDSNSVVSRGADRQRRTNPQHGN